jgi:hypothetical protein
MLKTIALAGVFFFASAISTTTLTKAAPRKSSVSAPTAPQPQGFCYPRGQPC